MFEDVKTYAPDEVYLTFGGHIVEGWDNIIIRRNNPEFKVVKGIRNKNTRVRDPNEYSTITVACHQTSLTNQVMSAIVELDKNTEGVRLEVSVIDGSGWEVFTSEEAFVRGTADRAYSSELGNREWVIECLNSRWNDNKRGGDTSGIFSLIGGLF